MYYLYDRYRLNAFKYSVFNTNISFYREEGLGKVKFRLYIRACRSYDAVYLMYPILILRLKNNGVSS